MDFRTSSLAYAFDLLAHFKTTREIAYAIKDKNVFKAKKFLLDVINRSRCVLLRQYNGGIGRTCQAKNEDSANGQGRWHEKPCKFLIDVLENAESNVEVNLKPCLNSTAYEKFQQNGRLDL